MVIPVKNSPLKLSTSFIIFLIYLNGFSIFSHDCIECQTNEHICIKSNIIAPPLPFIGNPVQFD